METALLGLLLGWVFFAPLVLFLLIICAIMGKWMTLGKMGRPGWAALIPFYADWQIALGASGDRVLGGCVVVLGILNVIAQNCLPDALSWLEMLVGVATFAASCVLAHRVSGAFGRGMGLTVALALIPSIAYLVIGLGSAEYRGPIEESRDKDA